MHSLTICTGGRTIIEWEAGRVKHLYDAYDTYAQYGSDTGTLVISKHVTRNV